MINKTSGILLFVSILLPLGAQSIFDPVEITAGNYNTIMQARAAYVMVKLEYPVVPGDVYQLVYIQGTAPKSVQFYIEIISLL